MKRNPLLTHLTGYVDGRWCGGEKGNTFAVLNPVNGERLAVVPDMGTHEAEAAAASAARAMASPVSLAVRRGWLESLDSLLREHKAGLGRIITLENGKPLREAMAEVEYAAGFFHFFATQLDHLQPHRLKQPIRNCAWMVHQRPTGVAALITPWNFPLAMLAKKFAAALAAGCALVAKPARQTPLTAIAFWHLLEAAGIPPGFCNLVLGQAGPIAEAFCAHPAVRVISFTGSTEVGRQLAQQCALQLKRLALELGGNAPFLVFEDADLEAAADALIANKFRAGGQTCVCTNRVLAHQSVAERFATRVVKRVRQLRLGDGMAPGTDIGPLINRAGFDKVAAHVADALAGGARRLLGSDPARPEQDWGAYYPPTVLLGVRPEMRVCAEETFGPVVAIGEFTTEAEALHWANATCYGLAAYLFTADAARAERVIAGLEFGHVGWNTGTGPTPEAPFGGRKQSGFGREGGLEGLLEFCEPQTVARG